MVIIRCVNPDCKKKKFEWDETEYGTGIAMPNEAGAARVIAVCPSCHTENMVWVKQVKKNDVITRGGGNKP